MSNYMINPKRLKGNLPYMFDSNVPSEVMEEYQEAFADYEAMANSHHAMKEALEDLIRAAELVAGDITDQDTGWYYQLQGRIQDGLKAITLANGKESQE